MESSLSLSLRTRIADEELANWEGQRFVPFARLCDLIQPQAIKSIFQERGIAKYQEDEAIEAVLNGGHRVFATLNAISQESSILLFRRNADLYLDKTLDSGLPYDQHSLESILPDSTLEFYQAQWRFASPVFRRNLHDRLLPKHTILPFIKVEKLSSQGKFAEVCRVTLAGSHQEIEPVSSGNIVLVQKKLNLSNDVEQLFKHEQHVLSMLRVLKHPNIVELHAAFTFQSRPTLLFSEAECDLTAWLRGGRSAQFSELETLEALYGLSSALGQMHHYFLEGQQPSMIGCHFDLHPGNILVRGKSFILSDFGLSRLKYEVQGSQSYFKGGVRDYCAPECRQWEDDFDSNKAGRPSDIWSFGCIITEIATFLKHGIEGLRTFDAVRRIQGAVPMLRTFHDRGRPHQDVATFIRQLGDDTDSHAIVIGLANVVSRMLTVDPLARPDIHWISTQLGLLSINARYREAVEIFQRLIPTMDYGWKIEYDRLTIWAKVNGLGKLLPTARGSKSLSGSSAQVHFENARRLLIQIGEDCSAQLRYSSDISEERGNFPLHVLRVSIEGLWQSQTTEVTRKMNAILENTILSVPDTEMLRMARFLSNGSRPQLLLAIKQAMSATCDNMNIKDSLQVDQTMISGHQEWQQRLIGNIRVIGEQNKYVLTEFLQYDDSWIGRSKELVTRINNLVFLLGSLHIENNLPLLRCGSFCHCPNRQAYGLMYDIPRHLVFRDRVPQPLTLVEVITKTESRHRRPALDEVFVLAHTLVESILSFHKAGWLHKGISAYNVVFFPRHLSSPGDSLSSVRLIGFDHSRESDEGVVTVGPRKSQHVRDYQHPAYRKAVGKIRFREEFDYYSLGLVLLELGRWKILSEITAAKHRKLLSPEDLQACLLKEEANLLKSSMGVYYYDATVACLSGFRGDKISGSNKKIWHEFDQEVVQRLTKCATIHPNDDK